jgi:plasmid stabilization system protein ParE
VDYEVTITPLALRDLEKIRRYIAEDNSLAADSFCQKLLDEAEALKTFPARGGGRPGTQRAADECGKALLDPLSNQRG